jgi:hypothetical protein
VIEGTKYSAQVTWEATSFEGARFMDVSYYHDECGGQLSDTKLHSRGKSLWQCSSCGFTGFPYTDIDIEGVDDDELSPVRIEIEDSTVYFIHPLQALCEISYYYSLGPRVP